NNIAAANILSGIEHWSTQVPTVMVGAISAYNGEFQSNFPASAGNHPHFVDSTLLGSGGTTFCVETANGYNPDYTVEGGYVGGCAIGGRGTGHATLKHVTMQNVVDMASAAPNDMPFLLDSDGVLDLPMPGQPLRAIVFGRLPLWPGGLAPFRDDTWAQMRLQR